jgi:hypothetical protein
MIEYAFNLDLPDLVFEDPVVKEMIEALFDISIWTNVRSFLSYFDSGITNSYVQSFVYDRIYARLTFVFSI